MAAYTTSSASPIEQQTVMETYETLSGVAFINMDPQGIIALSRDALLRLVFRSKAIVTAIATLSTGTHNVTVNQSLSVAHILNMQPKEIVAALSEHEEASSSTTSTTSSVLPSEPLPWRPNTRPKLPPGALLDIDQGPMYDILTEWLHIEDVCHLDSALCQKWRRAEFLLMLATKVLLFNREEIRVLTEPGFTDPNNDDELVTRRIFGAAALNWVLKRGIHLAAFQLPHSINNAEEQSIREAVASLALNGRLDMLEMISFNYCSYINDADLEVVLLKCYSSVKSIDIRESGLTVSAPAHIKRCAKLEAFAAKGNESVADMVEIFQSCQKLRKVNLSGFGEGLTDEVVLSVADNCHFLEHLNLGYCSAVDDSAIRRVAESCPLLQFVNLSGTYIKNATVVALCSRCPLLKLMFLGECFNLTDAAVLAVAERLPGLTHIDLLSIDGITSSAVETLASKCQELELINLYSCPNISDVTLAKIAEHCLKLERLHVYECDAVTAVGLTYIATKCSKLKYVELNIKTYMENIASLYELFPQVDWQ